MPTTLTIAFLATIIAGECGGTVPDARIPVACTVIEDHRRGRDLQSRWRGRHEPTPADPVHKEPTMRVTTWQQDQFITPARELHRWPGDFTTLDELVPSLDNQSLERPDTDATHLTHPANFTWAKAILYDHAYNRFVVIGKSTEVAADIGNYTINHDDLTKTSLYTVASTPGGLGGHHKQNAVYAYDYLWTISIGGSVYRQDMHNSAASEVYDGSIDGAVIILPVLDKLWLIDDTGAIHTWNQADTQFDSYYDPPVDIDVRFAVPYRGHVYLFTRPDDGSLIVYRIDDEAPASLHQVTWLPPATGEYQPADDAQDRVTAFTLHDDTIIFSPGAYITYGNDFQQLPVYAFSGSQIELLDIVDAPFQSPTAWGLHSWRGRVLLYFIKSGDQRLYTLTGDRFLQFSDTAYTIPTYGDLYCVAGDLLIVATVGGSDGVYHLQHCSSPSIFTSSWLDMGHPASKKHLVRLAAIISNPETDTKTKIEYRTEGGSWTEAVEEANARHVDVGNLGVDFYMLQIRVTLTDTGDPNDDVTLESLGATYSYGVP
jgi:hypothetical protein